MKVMKLWKHQLLADNVPRVSIATGGLLQNSPINVLWWFPHFTQLWLYFATFRKNSNHVKAISRKFTLLRGVNFKISLDFALHICKQTGQNSKSIA